MISLDLISPPAYLVKVVGSGSYLYLEANNALERESGYGKHLFDNRTPEQTLPRDLLPIVIARFDKCVRTGTMQVYEEELPGNRIVWRTTLIPIINPETGRIGQILGLGLNVTGQKRVEVALQDVNTRLSLALDAIKGAHWHLDVARNTFDASPALAVLLGEPAPRAIGADEFLNRIDAEDQDVASLHYLIDGSQDHRVVQYRITWPNGQSRWLRCRRMVKETEGKVSDVYGVTVDVTDEVLKAQELAVEALQDGLTSLYNRRGFFRRLDELVGRMSKEAGPLAIFMLDLNRFKAINDTHGHPVGDAVLVEVARRISAAIRPSDFCARLGGDEFAVAFKTPEAAMAACEARIREAVEGEFRYRDQLIQIRTSIGGIAASAGLDAYALIERADQALYADKRRSRNSASNKSSIAA